MFAVTYKCICCEFSTIKHYYWCADVVISYVNAMDSQRLTTGQWNNAFHLVWGYSLKTLRHANKIYLCSCHWNRLAAGRNRSNFRLDTWHLGKTTAHVVTMTRRSKLTDGWLDSMSGNKFREIKSVDFTCILNSEEHIPKRHHMTPPQHTWLCPISHVLPLTTAAVAFGHFVSVTPGAEGADLEGSCRIFQTEEAGLQQGQRNQVACLPCDFL